MIATASHVTLATIKSSTTSYGLFLFNHSTNYNSNFMFLTPVQIVTAHIERFSDALGMLYHIIPVIISLRRSVPVTAYTMHDESIKQDRNNTYIYNA